jgi:hypothetical protein
VQSLGKPFWTRILPIDDFFLKHGETKETGKENKGATREGSHIFT